MINRGPHTCIDLKTHYEPRSGKSVDYSNLRVFGCTVVLRKNVVMDKNLMFNPTVKFTISEYCGIEKQVEQREIEATCEGDEGSPQSHSEAETSVVPLSPGNITV